MKKIALLVLGIFLLTLTACSGNKRYSQTIYDTFDTPITLTAVCQSEDEFENLANDFFTQLRRYHAAFDIYYEHSGQNNFYTLNNAVGQWVQLPSECIELLNYGKQMHELTEGLVNIAMGEVLTLWKQARTDQVLPERSQLETAAQHSDINAIEISEDGTSARLLDPEMSVDVGAIAKGWAVEQAAQALSQLEGYVISAGGNVVTYGTNEHGEPWTIAVQSPTAADEYLTTLQSSGQAIVTSGGYERFAEIDGQKYHHIIDPRTLEPAKINLSVTIIGQSSAKCDVLSTAVFLLEHAEAQEILAENEVRAIILTADGQFYDTEQN